MVDVCTEICIDRPLEVVATYASNPENAPEWYKNIKSIEWKIDKGTLTVGSQMAFVAHFLGKKLEYVYEVVSYIPNEELVMRTAQGPFPMETSYSWIPLDENRTMMILRNTGEPKGFSRLFALIISYAMRKANQKDLKKIKSILEVH